MNALSTSDVDVDLENILQACHNFSDFSSEEPGNTTDDMSVDDLKINATPDSLVDYTQSVTLTLTRNESLPSKGLAFEWKCSKYNYNYKKQLLDHRAFSISYFVKTKLKE
ncbi:hypothetical protein PAMA_000478 [Pampus argenteus]